MTDTRPDNHTPEFPDDDRLLAYVLGLDDDPELEAAAAADEELRRRINLLRDQMAEATRLDQLIWANLEEFGYGR